MGKGKGAFGRRFHWPRRPDSTGVPIIGQQKKGVPIVLVGMAVAERMCVETVMSLVNFVHHPGPVDVLLNINSATVIHLARNMLVRKGLEHEAEWVLFIDADQVFDATDCAKLVLSDKDIIGAPIPTRSVPYTLNISFRGDDGRFKPIEEYPMDQIFPIDGIGMGFTLIKMDVFRKMKDPWFDFVTLPNGVRLGEDFSFCHKAKKAGFEIWTDPRVKVGHVGVAIYTIDDHAYYHAKPPPPEFKEPELISIIIPTRKRFEELELCLDAIKRNTVYPNYEIVIVFDGDEETYSRINGDYTKILLKERQEVLKALEAGLKEAKGDIVVNVEDNSRAGKGWLSFAYQKFLYSGRQAIVVLNDTIQKGNQPTHFLTSKQVLNEINDGHFYSPEYIHFFGDTDLAMRFKGTPRYQYASYSILTHLHPTAGSAEADEVYKLSMDESFKKDQKVFEEKFNVRFTIGVGGMRVERRKDGKLFFEGESIHAGGKAKNV